MARRRTEESWTLANPFCSSHQEMWLSGRKFVLPPPEQWRQATSVFQSTLQTKYLSGWEILCYVMVKSRLQASLPVSLKQSWRISSLPRKPFGAQQNSRCILAIVFLQDTIILRHAHTHKREKKDIFIDGRKWSLNSPCLFCLPVFMIKSSGG